MSRDMRNNAQQSQTMVMVFEGLNKNFELFSEFNYPLIIACKHNNEQMEYRATSRTLFIRS